MMTIMAMIMRIKTICEVINKSRIKVKVIMIMSIELVIAQSKRQLSTVVIKTSFIELENNRGGSRGRVQGVRTPPLQMTCGFLIQPVFCKKKLCGLLVLK